MNRRRLWRWTVIAWAVAVVAGGGLTLALQDSAAPPRHRWEENDEPAPVLQLEQREYADCSTREHPTNVACAYVVTP